MAENEARVIVGGSGISLSTALTIVFVVLKLIGTISWSWWWVLAPLWISAGISVIIIGAFLAIIGIVVLAARKA